MHRQRFLNHMISMQQKKLTARRKIKFSCSWFMCLPLSLVVLPINNVAANHADWTNGKNFVYFLPEKLKRFSFSSLLHTNDDRFTSVEGIGGLAWNQGILEKAVSVRVTQVEIRKIIGVLEKQTGVSFVYSSKAIEADRKINVQANGLQLGVFLNEFFKPLDIDFQVINNKVLLFKTREDLAGLIQSNTNKIENTDNKSSVRVNRLITGQVLGTDGAGLPGISVTVKNSNLGTSTNNEGRFSLEIPSGPQVLIFSGVGFTSMEQIVDQQTNLNVVLSASNSTLEDVVVVGFGSQKKVSVTGAISSIKTKEIIQAPVSSVANALAGRAPGIVAVQRGGEPGRDIAQIFVRGIATFNGETAPLVLVDGVPRTLNDIDPYTIESFNILKDASATAVFGVRGANGVIIITTKTGSTGKPQFNFSTNLAWQNPIRLPRLLDAVDYAKLRNEAEQNDRNDPNFRIFSEEDIESYRLQNDPYFRPNINWFDYMLKDFAPQQMYNLNVSGGTNDAKYFVSLGYLNQDGIYKLGSFLDDFSANPNFKRYNIRSNFDFNLSKNLSLYVKSGAQISNSNYSNSSTADIFSTILSANPLMSPVVYDGKLVRNVDGLTGFQISNTPMYQLLNGGFNTNFSSNLNIDIGGRLKLDVVTKGLSIRGKLAYDNFYNQAVSRTKQIPLWDLRRNPNAQNFADSIIPIPVVNQFEGPTTFNGESFSQNRRYYAEGAVDYSRNFNDHAVSGLLLGYVEREFRPTGGAEQLPFNVVGFVSRFTYGYMGKYLAELNMGYNGTENFARGKQFGFFPSGSVGYILSEEKFFPKNQIVSFLKLRGSYGLVGNARIGSERFLFRENSFRTGNNYFFGLNHAARPGYTENRLGNPNVTWEKATKMNLGLDMKFWDDRINLTAEYFTEDRRDILSNLNVPITFGQPSLIAPYNVGVTTNKGYEFELGFNDQLSKDFRYWVNANYSFARNKIIYRDEPPPPFPGLAITGNRIGQPKGLIATGIYNSMDEINDPRRPISAWEGAGLQPGDIRYQDVTGDGIIDQNDFTNIGFPNIPEIVYGSSAGFNYKGFEMSVFFQGAANVSTYISGEGAWPFIAGTKTAFSRAYESWSEERFLNGEKISLPRLTASPEANKHNYRNSSFWLEDAAYLRLKNVEIAYTLQSRKLKEAGIRTLRVYVNGQNLYTWTKMPYFDPEIANSNGAIYPMMRVFNAGFNVQF